jgi:hypothetical protein
MPDERYHATLKFPWPKNAHPGPDEILAQVAEVVQSLGTPPPAEQASVPAPAAPVAPAAPAPVPEQAMATIPPPPPPADQPPATVKVGQSKDEVVSNFGQPTKVATVGTKQILYYPDFKVTLVAGKVTDVQ